LGDCPEDGGPGALEGHQARRQQPECLAEDRRGHRVQEAALDPEDVGGADTGDGQKTGRGRQRGPGGKTEQRQPDQHHERDGEPLAGGGPQEPACGEVSGDHPGGDAGKYQAR
jgi:hypothetical protein